MTKESGTIYIVVAHPTEGEAVSRAASRAGCGCEVVVAGVGGAATSWVLYRIIGAIVPPGNGLRPGIMAAPLPAPIPVPVSGTAAPPVAEYRPAGSLPPPSLIIGAGIAGSYTSDLAIGSVVVTASECFADMGIDDNGSFRSLFDSGLADPDEPPFTGGRLLCSNRWFEAAATELTAVRGATVNTATGTCEAAARIRGGWDPQIETMEGAWLAYACMMAGVPWLGVRAISNMVEPRNTANWNIPLALERLQEEMTTLLRMIVEMS